LGKLLITNRQGLGIGIPANFDPGPEGCREDDTSIATGVSPWKTKINEDESKVSDERESPNAKLKESLMKKRNPA
jgi:hypothetical protein